MKIKTNDFIIILINIIIFLIVPNTILENYIPNVLDAIKILAVVWMGASYIYTHIYKKAKIELIDILLLINSIYLIIVSTIKDTISYSAIYTCLMMFLLPVYIRDSLKKSNNVLTSLYVIYVIITLATLVTTIFPIIITARKRIYTIIGGKNAVDMVMVPAMLVITIYSLNKHEKIDKMNMVLILLCIALSFASQSSTGIVISVIALIYVLFLHKKFISLRKYTITYIITFFIIIFGMQLLQGTAFDKIMQNIIGKGVTFSNRTRIWNVSVENIKESPIIGYGIKNQIVKKAINNGFVTESHNMLLELMLSGGIISLIIFISILYNACKKLNRNTEINKALIFYLILYFIIGLMESMIFNLQLWMIIGLICFFGEESTNINTSVKKEQLLGG